MKLENERFLLVKKTKKFIMELYNITSFFPNRDYVGKNSLVQDSFSLLENIYYINFWKEDDEVRNYQKIVITKINMLDFYLERAYKLHYISESQCLKLCNSLTEINKMFVAWTIKVNNGKTEKIQDYQADLS